MNLLRSTMAAALATLALSTLAAGQRTEPVSLYTPEQRSSHFDACRDLFPGGKPVDLTKLATSWKARGLCSDSFAVVHSGLSKTPLLVVERLNRAQLQDAKDEKRTDEFYADPRLPASERADLKDFAGRGFDRGHLAPAGDAPTKRAMAQSFALSNMVPQNPIHNQKTWRKLEADTRHFVLRAKGDVFVFTGPYFGASQPATVGRGQVWIPPHLFKLVYDQASGKAWAHVLPNTADAKLGEPMSYAEFEKLTGWHLLDGLKLVDPVQP